jgi:error-prone DNA polymerase
MVTHARPWHFPAQDALVCAETLCLVDEIVGRKPPRDPGQPAIPPTPSRALNAERYFRSASEMAEHFSDRTDLLANTLLIAERCDDDVMPSRPPMPSVTGNDAQALSEIVWTRGRELYPQWTPKQRRRLDYELKVIIDNGFASHFLIASDFCDWAREQRIQFSGRGSVVDSAISYVLGFSRIDAMRHNLHFDRFLPPDGTKRPDIDIDFEARKRDDVRSYIVRKYGIENTATVCAFGAYCTRGIVREVGKALGLPNEVIGFLAKRIHGGVPPDQIEAALEHKPELRGSGIDRERFRWVFRLAERLMDVPRNIRVHSSGVVVSADPIRDVVPVMWSASPGPKGEDEGWLRLAHWDKRSIKHCYDKFDILCLRGQDVLAGTDLRVRQSDTAFRVESVPIEDEESYRAMRSGELIGIPQSASPAMRQAHIRMRTANLDDASLVQAGIRPGVGGAVKLNEMIARRRGKPFSFAHPDLEEVLGHTWGIIVFQEQVDQLLQKFCGYSAGQAEDIRDAIHKRRKEDFGSTIRDVVLERVQAQGYERPVAEEVFNLVSGFKGYGFAQGHALAFAEVSIRSIWCQQNHPAEYFSALLSAQPAGYYGPCTIVNEARSRGVPILPPDVNRSELEFSVEDVVSENPRMVIPGAGIRVGLDQIAGISKEVKLRILQERIARIAVPERVRLPLPSVSNVKVAVLESDPPTAPIEVGYRSFFEFVAKVRPPRDELETLILSGALDPLVPNRRAALWAIPSAMDFAKEFARDGQPVLPLDRPEPPLPTEIPDFDAEERAVFERRLLGLDVQHHLMAFERERVAERGGISTDVARRLAHGRKAFVVGNPIRLRFPPTPSGKRVVFFDLEDETGLLNVTCFDDVYQRDGHTIVCSPYVTVIGEAQDRDGHIAFLAHRVFPYRPFLMRDRKERLPIAVADFLVG